MINQIQRDTVKGTIPEFRTTTYKGTGTRNLRTDQFVPGNYIEGVRKGYSLPTFEDLVRGLQHLPSGLDARDLTQCLSWYLDIRNTFTPQLDLNVLHTQALIRALRQPLKPFGPQNLDRNALIEWQSKGKFENREVEDRKPPDKIITTQKQHTRSQMQIDLNEGVVDMTITLPLRHVLTFPFLALHKVVGEALKLGIKKAASREAKRTLDDVQNSKDVDSTPESSKFETPIKPYRIPKLSQLAPKSDHAHNADSPSNSYSQSRSGFSPAPSNRSRDSAIPYRPYASQGGNLFGRREYQHRRDSHRNQLYRYDENPRRNNTKQHHELLDDDKHGQCNYRDRSDSRQRQYDQPYEFGKSSEDTVYSPRGSDPNMSYRYDETPIPNNTQEGHEVLDDSRYNRRDHEDRSESHQRQYNSPSEDYVYRRRGYPDHSQDSRQHRMHGSYDLPIRDRSNDYHASRSRDHSGKYRK